jgi:hypothetical protein
MRAEGTLDFETVTFRGGRQSAGAACPPEAPKFLQNDGFKALMIRFSVHFVCPPPETQGQTYRRAIELICDVDKLAGLSADDNPITVGQQRNDWLAERVENPDGIFFQTVFSVKTASDKAALLRKEMKVVGLDRCVLADSLEREAREAPEVP